MPSLCGKRRLPRPHAANSHDEAKRVRFKSCLFTLALLIVYIFSEQACDVPAPRKLCKIVMNNATFEEEPRCKCFADAT